MNNLNTLATAIADQYICECCVGAIKDHLHLNVLNEVRDQLAEQKYPHAEFFEALFKALSPHEKRFANMVRSIWEEERKIIVANLKKLKKAYITQKDNDDIVDQVLYPRVDYQKKLEEEAKTLFAIILADMGQQELDKLGIEISFDVTNPEVTKWLKDYCFRFSENLEEINIALLRKELIAGLEAGESIPMLIKRVNETYENWNKFRSETIARTEAIRASNRANLEAYKQAGIKKKEWLTHHSPETCAWCKEMDGKIISIGTPFFKEGDEFSVSVDGKDQAMRLDYETVEAPPLHPRCRCALVPVVE